MIFLQLCFSVSRELLPGQNRYVFVVKKRLAKTGRKRQVESIAVCIGSLGGCQSFKNIWRSLRSK
jgi:hypothetical protein